MQTKKSAYLCNVIENKTVTTGRQPVHRVGQKPTYIAKQKTGVAPVTHKTGGHCPTKRQNGCTAVALWLIEQKTRDTMAI